MSQSNPIRTIILLGAILPCVLLGAETPAQSIQEAEYVQALRQELALYPNLRPELAAKLILVESHGRIDTPDGAHGEIGAMQIRPETFKYVAHNILHREDGELNSRLPNDNLVVGVALLNWLLARYDNNEPLALVAYNAGIGTADRAKQTIAQGGVAQIPATTRAYIKTILGPAEKVPNLQATPILSAIAIKSSTVMLRLPEQSSAYDQSASRAMLREHVALVPRPKWPMMSASKEWDPAVIPNTRPIILAQAPRALQTVFRRPAIPS